MKLRNYRVVLTCMYFLPECKYSEASPVLKGITDKVIGVTQKTALAAGSLRDKPIP